MNALRIAAFCLLIAAPARSAAPPKTKLSVIVNAKSPLGDSLPAARLKEIFLGTMTAEKTVKVFPVNNKELLETFLAQHVGLTPTAYKQHWIKRMLNEGGDPPAMAESSKVVLTRVSEEAGAVGYIGYVAPEEAVGVKGVRVLNIVEKADKTEKSE